MKYTCTRNSDVSLSASEAIIKDNILGGGLIVPSSFPYLGAEFINGLADLDFADRTAKVLALFMDEFSYEELSDICHKAYAGFEDDECPVVKVEDALYLMELWHGETNTVKDMSAAIFPLLFEACKKKLGISDGTKAVACGKIDEINALLNSYDRAKCADVLCFYPNNGVDELRNLALNTNAYCRAAYPVESGIDEIKSVVRRELASLKKQANGALITRADCMNIGRVLPLVACFVSAYCDLISSGEVSEGEKINLAIPVGNFSLAIAGYYAMRMGVPVKRFVFATNANKCATEFFESGVVNANRDLYMTKSPGLDVLVPEGLEALIFELCGGDGKYVAELYSELYRNGKFEMELDEKTRSVFLAGWADESDTAEAAFVLFDLDDCVIDPHTAVAAGVYNEYSCEYEDDDKTLIASTASPYLYAKDVLGMLGTREKDALKAVNRLQAATALEFPESLSGLQDKKYLGNSPISVRDIPETLRSILGIK